MVRPLNPALSKLGHSGARKCFFASQWDHPCDFVTNRHRGGGAVVPLLFHWSRHCRAASVQKHCRAGKAALVVVCHNLPRGPDKHWSATQTNKRAGWERVSIKNCVAGSWGKSYLCNEGAWWGYWMVDRLLYPLYWSPTPSCPHPPEKFLYSHLGVVAGEHRDKKDSKINADK